VKVNAFGAFPEASFNTLLSPDDVQSAMTRHLIASQVDWAQKRLGIDHNKTRMVRKTTTAIPFGLPQFSESVYEASRRFRAVRVPGVALIVRHTPFSS